MGAVGARGGPLDAHTACCALRPWRMGGPGRGVALGGACGEVLWENLPPIIRSHDTISHKRGARHARPSARPRRDLR